MFQSAVLQASSPWILYTYTLEGLARCSIQFHLSIDLCAAELGCLHRLHHRGNSLTHLAHLTRLPDTYKTERGGEGVLAKVRSLDTDELSSSPWRAATHVTRCWLCNVTANLLTRSSLDEVRENSLVILSIFP